MADAPTLAHAVQRWRTLFDNAGDAIFIHDLTPRFLEVNRVACERLGYSREELLQLSPLDIDAPEDAAHVDERIELLRTRGHFLLEVTHVARDGRRIPTELSARVIEYDGEPAVLTLARDVSDRKRAEELARRTAASFQTMIERLPDAVAVFRDERVVYANPAMLAYLGYGGLEEMTGRPLSEVLHADCANLLAGDGEAHKRELRFVRCDGRVVTAEATALPLEYGGAPATLLVTRDLTEVVELRRTLGRERSFRGIHGQHPRMRELFELIESVAASDVSVLVTGETGTGKELVASAVHLESARAARPFVPVNCGALPEGLLESELFGHVRGAFTGAVRDKKGRFELAHGGTIFLDEIGELAPAIQVKLLRVLQDRCIQPVGAERATVVDVRIIAATNRNLRQEVRAGRFREDLFFRLCVVPIHLPPLRERGADVLLVAEHLLDRMAEEQEERSRPRLSADARAALLEHRWPGNVRELMNALQYASVRCRGSLVERRHLPPELQPRAADRGAAVTGRRLLLTPEQVDAALAQTGGNKSRAARLLGVGRATLYRYLGST